MFRQPLDRELGIEPAGFSDGGFRLLHLSREPIGGGQVRVDKVSAKTSVDGLVQLVDGRVKMAKTEFRNARDEVQ